MLELMLVLALLLLAVLIWRPFRRNVLGALDTRAEKIRAELDEAQRLHEEARALLARYQRQLGEGEKLAEEIQGEGRANRQRLEARMRAELEAAVARRTELAMERIAQEEARAVAEVRGRAADLAIRTTRRLLTERLGEREAQALIQSSIEDVSRKLA